MEQHDYIVLLEKFFKKEASSEERRILIEWIRKPGIRKEFNLLCEQMWKEAAVEIDKTVEEEMWNHLQRNLDEPNASISRSLQQTIKRLSLFFATSK